MSISDPVMVSAPTLEDAAADVLGELQSSCAELLDALPQSIRRAVDLEQSLKLDKKLAWQIFKIARANHPLAEALNVPPPTSVSRLSSAAKKQVSPTVIERLQRAFERFESLVTKHAGDREAFNSLIGSLIGEPGHDVAKKHRRDMFRASSRIWGVRADAGARCEVYFPSKDVPGGLDAATLTCYRNLQRLRYDANISVTVGAMGMGDASKTVGKGKYTLDADALPILLEEFSDHPVGHGPWVPDPHKKGHAKLDITDLGRTGAATLFTLQRTRATSDAQRHNLHNGVSITTPTQLIICDLLVPTGISDSTTARMLVRGSRTEFPIHEVRQDDVLPHREHVDTYVNSVGVPETPEIPRYREVVSHVLKTLGWDSTRYDLYRCRVEYPIFHTIVRVDVDAMNNNTPNGQQ